MHYRKLGRSGLSVSVVGLGCNNFNWTIDCPQSLAVVEAALEAGITLFDTANIYGNSGGSEEFLGRALSKKRKDVVVATKFGMAMADGGRGADRSYIITCVEASLKRLGTDWIDLYQLHESDPSTPIDETLHALDRLISQGKIRYIGTSNMPDWQVAQAHYIAKQLGFEHFISLQAEYSWLKRDAEATTIPCLNALGMGVLPYFPLASGLLTGKYRGQTPEGSRFEKLERLADRYMTEANLARIEKLRTWCDSEGLAMTDVAFAWLLSAPSVSSVMAGATKPEQVTANAKAAQLVLSAEQLRALNAL